MAAKLQVLVAAALVFSALGANDGKVEKIPPTTEDLETAKDVANAFEEALMEEEPLLKEEEQRAGALHQNSLVRTNLRSSEHAPVVAVPVSTDPAVTGEWASEFEKDVTDLVLGLSKGGFAASPLGPQVKQISKLIEEDMMPKVVKSHNVSQDQINKLGTAADKCFTDKGTGVSTANLKKASYQKVSKNHKECRGEESALYTENLNCAKESSSLCGVKNLKCRAYSLRLKFHGESDRVKHAASKSGNEETETYVRRLDALFCKNGTGILFDLISHKSACLSATKKCNDIVKRCTHKDTGLGRKWADKKKACNTLQDSMDTSSCQWTLATKNACDTYDSCHRTAQKAYEDFHDTTKTMERDRKAEWKGLQRMKCIIDSFADGKVTLAEIKSCKGKNHSVANLTIAYQDKWVNTSKPAKTCKHGVLYPHTPQYKAAEFTPLPMLAKGKGDANTCIGVTNQADPTPKAGSPQSCSCKKVALNGKYSAGTLIKCKSCNDVYKSLQKNSCPIGTKIFSPRTREDWKTILASVKPLRAPNWIIDITRTANGCGGCATAAMNSKVPAQATWHTADASPWWLRNTAYLQPSGDYTANCYLDVLSPANENSVTFNDGKCAFHAKSYYCQTAKQTTTTTTTTKAAVATTTPFSGPTVAPVPAKSFKQPYALLIDGADVYVADVKGHVVVKWPMGAAQGQVVAGNNGKGAALNQLSSPSSVLLIHGFLYIAEWTGRRVSKWYPGAERGEVVAGGNGKGKAMNQFQSVGTIAMDPSNNLFVADCHGARIMKFRKGAKMGVVVAGGNWRGAAMNQLNGPSDFHLDSSGKIYVSDCHNRRIMMWAPGAKEGVAVVGNINGQKPGYLFFGFAMDTLGNFFVNTKGGIVKWVGSAEKGVVAAQGVAADGNLVLDKQSNFWVIDKGKKQILKWPMNAKQGKVVAG